MKNNIKAAREKQGLTQQECAELFNVKLRAWQTYEQGVSEPKFEVLCKIADKFGVTTDYLLGREPEPNDPIKDMSDRLNLNPYERAIISAYLAMDPKSRKDLVKMISDVAESIKSGTEYEKTYTMHIDPKEKQN